MPATALHSLAHSRAPRARCFLEPEDTCEAVTVTREACYAVTIVDADGNCIQFNDLDAARSVAEAIWKAARS